MFFIVYQVTFHKNALNFLQLNPARIDTSYHGLSHPFKGAGTVAIGLSGTKTALVASHNFQMTLNILGFSSTPTSENLQD